MNQRKEEMLDAAVQLFQKNGLHATSVENITTACGISKGGFYKHFDSKESMILEVLQRYYDKLFWEADHFSKDLHRSPLQVLKTKVTIELEKSIGYRYFFHAVLTDFPPDNTGPIPKSLLHMQRQLHEWHKCALLEAFGQSVGNYLTDLAVMMEGMIHSYLMKMIWEGPILPLDRVASLIVECLHAIAANDEHIYPVLPEQQTDVSRSSILENMKYKLEEVRAALYREHKEGPANEKDIQTIDFLIDELEQQEPREFLVDALLSQLHSRQNLTKQITVILTTWEIWKDDER